MRAITSAAVGTGSIAVADRFPKERQDSPPSGKGRKSPYAEPLSKAAKPDPRAQRAQGFEFGSPTEDSLPSGAMFSVSLAAEELPPPAPLPHPRGATNWVPPASSLHLKNRLA